MKIGILGTGLLGASIGLRARERGHHVIGHDASEEAQTIAKTRGALDEIVPRDAIYTADIAVIALPVEATITELHRLYANPAICHIERSVEDAQSRYSTDHRIIIDIGSVKFPIAEAAAGIPNFISTHPFAGRERSGAAAANATLFEGKPWVYVPTEHAEHNAAVEAFILEMGSTPYTIDAERHDAVVAATSHLPQLLAWLFAERYAEDDAKTIESLSGPVARELQRIARSERPMWREIFRANAGNLVKEARALSEKLGKTADALERGDEVV